MNRQGLMWLAIVAVLAISAAIFISGRRNAVPESAGMQLFPALAGQINSVNQVTVLKGSPTALLTLQKQGQQWTVAERANYPADVPKLRQLLQSLADAKILEEKTSNPASYAVIGVEDPLKPGAGGAEVQVSAADGKHAVIVGKSAPNGNFVRRAGEEKSYSVSPGISVDVEPRYWIDTKLLDLPVADIQKVDMKLASGGAYSIHRAAPRAPAPAPVASAASAASAAGAAPAAVPPPPADFVLDAVPAGRQASDPQTLSPSPTTYSNLSADDVAQAADIDFSKPSVATVALSSGKIVTLTGTVVGDKHWITLASTQDAALNARAAGRAYEISNFRYDAIFRPVEQLLVPKAAPEAKKTAPSKQPHAQSSPKP